MLAVTQGPDWGWTSYRVLILATAGVLLLALFVFVELEVDEPVLDVRIFRYWPFVNSLILVSVLELALYVPTFFLPLFMQEVQNLPAAEAGLLSTPQVLVMGALMPLSGFLYDKIGPRLLIGAGLAINAWGTYLLCGINVDMTRSEVIGWTMFRAVGIGMSMMPIMTAGIDALPPTLVESAAHSTA